MFDEDYLTQFTLACWLITFGQFSDVTAFLPAGKELHHRCVLLAALQSPSHNSCECTLALLLLGDNFVVILTSPNVLRLKNSVRSAGRSDENDILQQWPCLRLPSARRKSQKLGDASDPGIAMRIFSIQSFKWSPMTASDSKPFKNPSEYLFNLPAILHERLLDLQALVKCAPQSHTPRTTGRETLRGQRSNASPADPQRQLSLFFSHTGGGLALRIGVIDMNDLDNEARFGCFIGKFRPNLHQCGRARRHWKFVRSLCRSQHLADHNNFAHHLTLNQLNHIREMANTSTRNDEAETWRDCFVYLYPQYEPFRHRLNPYVGQRLLDPEENQLERLQQQANEVAESASNRPRGLPFLSPAVEDSDLRAPITAAPMRNNPRNGRHYPPSGSRPTHSRGSSFSHENYSQASSRRSDTHVAGQQAAQVWRISGRRGSSFQSTSSQRSARSGYPAPAPTNIPIDPQLEFNQPVPQAPATPYLSFPPNPSTQPVHRGSDHPVVPSRESVPSVTTATTRTLEADQYSLNEDSYPPARLPTPSDFPRTSPNDVVPRMIGDVPYGLASLPEFERDMGNLQNLDPCQDQGQQVLFINPYDMHYQPPEGTHRNRPRRHQL